MIHQTIKILLFFLFTTNAQVFDSLKIEGNSQFDYDYIKKNFNISDLKNDINFKKVISKHFYGLGYYSLNFKSEKIRDTNKKLISIYPETQYIIDNVIIKSQPNLSERLKAKLTSINADKNIIEEILSDYSNELFHSGFINAEIKISTIEIDTLKKTLDIYLEIKNITSLVVKNISFAGNKKTTESTLKEIIFFRNNKNYSTKRNDEIVSLLKKTNYFQKVEYPELLLNNNGTGSLHIKLEEKNTNNFDGVLGYIPSDNGGYLTGLININLRNLFGTGRNFKVKWQKLNKNSQEFDISYFEPWIFNLPLNFAPSFYQYSKDTTYTRRILNFELSYFLTSNITAAVIFESETVNPSVDFNNTSITKSDKLNTGLSLTVNTKNDKFFPTEGFLISNKYLYSSKKTATEINGNKNFSQQKLELEIEYYKEFISSFVGTINLKAYELRGNTIETSDLFEFGGNNSLRGYYEKEFSASRLGLTNLEFRYLLDGNSFIFSFLDIAYYNLSKNIIGNLKPEFEDIIFGYGAGIKIDTNLGIISFSYAIGKNDTFSNGKIHVGLINEF